MKLFYKLSCLIFISSIFLGCSEKEHSVNNKKLDFLSNDITLEDSDLPIHVISSQIKIDQQIFEMKDQLDDNPILGYWFGYYNNVPMGIIITSFKNNLINGFVIREQIYHEIKGWFNSDDGILYNIGVSELGNLNNGYYELALSLEDMSINGTWMSIDNKDASNHTIILAKRNYEYDVTTGQYPELSQREMSLHELTDLPKIDLEYIVNEIKARHGYVFQNKETLSLFSNKEWYCPLNLEVSHLYTKKEKKNLNSINRILKGIDS